MTVANGSRTLKIGMMLPQTEGLRGLMGTQAPRMMACMAKYADQWNAYYSSTNNTVDGARELLLPVDEACTKEGRDPATLERTVTVLIANPSAEPWWDRMPSSEVVEDKPPLKPLYGAPETIAQALLEYEAEGISHVQINLEPTTCETIEALVPVLEALDKA